VTVRPALLAGLWYPDDPVACRRALDAHLAAKALSAPAGLAGLVGPHAGWRFSGDAAGAAYRALADARGGTDLVVVFGGHRGPDGPQTVFCGTAWDTPLGRLATALPLAEALRRDLALGDEPLRPRRPDNAVELHLPFVRAAFPEAELLVVGVAASERARAVGRTVGEACRGRDAVFVASTDLTHYGPSYGFEPVGRGPEAVRWVRERNDGTFLEHLLEGDDAAALAHASASGSACCPGAVVAAFEALRAYGGAPDPALLRHDLSCDVRPAASFVGYGALTF
jgi:AmmeMemoRadiSam system protein B